MRLGKLAAGTSGSPARDLARSRRWLNGANRNGRAGQVSRPPAGHPELPTMLARWIFGASAPDKICRPAISANSVRSQDFDQSQGMCQTSGCDRRSRSLALRFSTTCNGTSTDREPVRQTTGGVCAFRRQLPIGAVPSRCPGGQGVRFRLSIPASVQSI